jgi:hypothetical protein
MTSIHESMQSPRYGNQVLFGIRMGKNGQKRIEIAECAACPHGCA